MTNQIAYRFMLWLIKWMLILTMAILFYIGFELTDIPTNELYGDSKCQTYQHK